MKSMDARLLEVINDIYAVALEPKLWPEVLNKVSAMVGADAATVWIHDFADKSASFELTDSANVAAFVGFEPGTMQQYAEHYSMVNVWTENEDRLPSGSVVTSSNLFPDTLLKKTEFGDWLRHQDLFYALGSIVQKENTRAVKMSFLRPERAGGYDDDAMQVLRVLMPHLRTAVAIHRRMHQVQGIAHVALGALDRLNFGVVLLGPTGEVRHVNALAKGLSARTQAFSIGQAGHVQALVPGQTHQLRDAARAVALARTQLGAAGGKAIRLKGRDGCELHAHVVPMPPSAHRFGSAVAAMMFVSDPAALVPSLGRKLQEFYQLSPSEALLAEALVAGKSLKEFSEERGTTMNTVKTQLKSVAAKVGAKRQVDIVRCILTGPAVIEL
ncbi:MAG TPA: hypothetical protein VHL79_11165 [Ramlibacter sp.]|jgi:DNA-binding CsgD family transcriptional regulator|nr:hypothetical protein [Ramlibacter sp.]